MKTRVLLVGGRSKAKSLASSLIKKGYQVTVINNAYEDCLKLAEIDRLTVIQGDGTRPFVLEDASAGEADIAIALRQPLITTTKSTFYTARVKNDENRGCWLPVQPHFQGFSGAFTPIRAHLPHLHLFSAQNFVPAQVINKVCKPNVERSTYNTD